MRSLVVVLSLAAVACSGSKVADVPCAKDSDCQPGEACSSRGCAPCPTCNSDERCVGGECLSINCGNVACHADEGCSGGRCVDGLCIGVTCSTDTACVHGQCLPISCGGVQCPIGQVCSSGACVDASCVGVACPAGEQCAGGSCLSTACDGVSCPQGWVCSNNACVDPACVGVLCPGGNICSQGLCLPTACGAVPCPSGQACVLGQCVSVAAPDAGSDGGSGVDAGFDAGNPVICADGGTGCTIGGVAYPCGALEPGNLCRSCQPTVSSSGWTAYADGQTCDAGAICGYGQCVAACDVGGVLVPPGVLDPSNACQACQPQASTSSFSSIADGTPCAGGKRCIAGACADGCQINGASYAAGALDLSNACHVCRPSTSTSAWSNAADGTSCGQGQVCSLGACVTDCFIDGGYVTPGALDVNNLCRSCQPASAVADYTNLPDGTPCGGVGHCGAGACVCPSPGVLCSTACVDERTNAANCGACGTGCGRDAGLPDGGLAQSACFARACGLPLAMPEPRAGLAAAAAPDGLIYLFGGTNAPYLYYNAPQCNPPETGNPLPAGVLAYNPVANTWSTPTSMPTPRELLGATVGSDGRLYTVGGATRDPSTGVPVPTNVVEVYDTVTKMWSTLPPLPTARFALGVVTATDGRIYAIGGCAQYVGLRGVAPQHYCSAPVSTVEVYTADAGTWASGINLSSPVWALSAAPGPSGDVFAIGGDNLCNTAVHYVPGAGSWAAAPPTTDACYGTAVMAKDGRILQVGGISATPYECGPNAIAPAGSGHLLTAFRPGTASWTQLASLGTARAWSASAVAADGRVFTFGGTVFVYGAAMPVTSSIEVYDPALGVWAP
jgi:hypothetical protein